MVSTPQPEGANERVLDVARRLRHVRLAVVGSMLLAFAGSVPWLGWPMLVPFLLSVVALVASNRFASSSRYPQIVGAVGLFATAVGVGVAAALTGGVKSPLLFLLIVSVAGMAFRYDGRVLLAGMIGSAIVALAACLGPTPAAFAANPTPLFFVLCAICCVGTICVTTQRFETYHRAQAVIDPLTGLFNRSSLMRRFFELRQQALVTGQSLSIIACDLDHFKLVNDEHGHSRGDAVLKDVAYTMRKVLRFGDLAYRVGGEEFVIVLPGLDTVSAVAAADRLREAIQDSKPAGISVTMSFGVASIGQEHRDWLELYELADSRLYEAKKRGRNQVCPTSRAAAPPQISATGAAVSAAEAVGLVVRAT